VSPHADGRKLRQRRVLLKPVRSRVKPVWRRVPASFGAGSAQAAVADALPPRALEWHRRCLYV